MFDFDNTPITKYTKLKAIYNCGVESLLTYNGDWARVTLIDGTELECQNKAEFDNLMVSSGSSSVNGVSVLASNVKKIEFGTKVTTLGHNSLRTVFFTNLSSINGFHKGLTSIGNYFLFGNNRGTVSPQMDGEIVIPSTVTSIGSYFMNDTNTFVGTITFNALPTIDSAGFMMSEVPSAPSYKNGVKIMGAYAGDIIAQFPNSNASGAYRNLYNGITLDDFLKAFDKGIAYDVYPAGARIPDSSFNTQMEWVVLHYGVATLPDGTQRSGVYLLADRVLSNSQPWDTTTPAPIYGESDLASYLSSQVSTITPALQNRIAEIKVPYSTGSGQDYSPQKLWALSTLEMCASGGTTLLDDGVMLDYYVDKAKRAGFTGNADLALPARQIPLKSNPSTSGMYWTRARNGNYSAFYVDQSGAVKSVATTNTGVSAAGAVFVPTSTTNFTLTALKDALDNGKAQTLFPIGTKIQDTYDGDTITWVVASYNTATLATGTSRPGVYLCSPTSISNRLGYNSFDYGQSTINSYLNGEFLEACSDELRENAATIAVPYRDNVGNKTVGAKVWIPSATEVYGTKAKSDAVEGQPWWYWGQRSRLLQTSDANNSYRLVKTPTGTADTVWLRSFGRGGNYLDVINSAGAIVSYQGSFSVAFGITPAFFIPAGDGDVIISAFKTALDNGTAPQSFPIGTEIVDFYNGIYNPLIVCHYGTATDTNGQQIEGAYLCRKYIVKQMAFNTVNTPDYVSSLVHAYLRDEYPNGLSTAISTLPTAIQVPYSSNTWQSGATVDATWFVMSPTEIWGTSLFGHDGVAWDYWKNLVGTAEPTNAKSANRVVYNTAGAAIVPWLRSGWASNNQMSALDSDGKIFLLTISNAAAAVLPACFIKKGQ